MCGIVGWVGPGPSPFSRAAFEAATLQLAHRGPDDQGLWFDDGVMLGHRRLSIVDLSAAGHQPMRSTSGSSHIVFNGEIYNHVELRREQEAGGRRIAGGSDTGVLLELIESDGPAALSRLNGMFAFGWWDAKRRRLLLCRDRFGVKPLYYRIGADGLAFASEPKALLALYPEHRRADTQTVLSFLAHNELCAGDRSFYEGIRVLPAAHMAVYDPQVGSLRVQRWWDYPESGLAETRHSVPNAREEFAALFDDAVRIRLRSDVPVGLTLSGGLDSTAVLAAASRHASSPLRCFTSVYGADSGKSGRGELSWAERASRAVGAPLTPVPATRADWLAVMNDVVWHMDGPGYSPAVYPLWRLMQRARADGVPVLLEGQGADEALAGYPQYGVLELLDFLGSGGWAQPAAAGQRLAGLRASVSWRWALAWLLRESFPGLLDWRRRQVGFQSVLQPDVALPAPDTTRPTTGDRVYRRLLDDHARAILPGLLQYGDSISMAHAIESRHPFLDVRLVEWLFRAPTTVKLSEGQSKWVLREYLRAHGQVDIGNRRDKQGYPTPAGEWLASKEGREIETRMLAADGPLLAWCTRDGLRRLFDQNRRGVLGASHHLYKLASTQMWMDRCLAPEDRSA